MAVVVRQLRRKIEEEEDHDVDASLEVVEADAAVVQVVHKDVLEDILDGVEAVADPVAIAVGEAAEPGDTEG